MQYQEGPATSGIIADNSACIIDGKALVQSVEGNNMTFGDVSNTILNKALRRLITHTILNKALRRLITVDGLT